MDVYNTSRELRDYDSEPGIATEERRFQAMAEIAFRSDLTFDQKIQQFLAMGCAYSGAEAGVLGRVTGENFRIEYASTADGPGLVGFTCRVEDTLCRETLQLSTALAIEQIGASPHRNHPAYGTHKTEAYIGATVLVYDREYGTLSFNSKSPRARPFTTSDKNYVRLMALWAGSELERHLLMEELECRVEERSHALAMTAKREQLLREIGLAIRATLVPDEIEYHAARLLGGAIGADRCFFVHFDLGRDNMRFTPDWRRPDMPSVAGTYQPSAFAVEVQPLFASGGNLVINDAAAEGWPKATIDMLASLDIRAVIDVPLFRDGDLEAVLCVAMEQPRQWTDGDIALVEAVAAQTRTSIETASVIQRERRIAATLQNALLPPLPPTVPGMELGYAYRPALAESNVGGDFYAAYRVREHTYALIIGDVSGKGLAAASQVSALQNILRYALCAARTLSEAVTQMNNVVIEHNLLAGFATVFVGLYNAETLTLTYCSCGHEPPLILAAEEIEPLRTSGPPLGVVAGVEYSHRSLQLAAGDMILFYTDGLSEAGPDRRSLLGPEGLADLFRRRVSHGTVSDIATGLIEDAAAYADGRLQDDACVIVAKLTGGIADAFQADTTASLIAGQAAPSLYHMRAPGTLSDRLRVTPLEDQFRLLVESVAEYAIFLLEPSGHILTWNTGAERLKGYAASEIIGKHFSIFYTPDDVNRGHPLDELAIAATEGRYEEEGWRVRKDGSRFWANVVITALRDSEGILTGYGKVTRDFTERRRAEQQLQRSEERFRLLVQGVRDYAIFMLDPSGKVASWNEGAQRLKGYQAHEVIGQHFSRFYTPEDVQRNHPAHELAVAAAEGRYEEEGWRVRKDGSRFWANVVITALHDPSGNLYGFAKITRDFTDRRAAEEGRIIGIRDEISRAFLREILFSVTEGRLRFCEEEAHLPTRLDCQVEETPLVRAHLAVVRKHVARIAASIGFTAQRIGDIVTAASEAAMNAVVHAHHTRYAVCASETTIQVWIMDGGNGIEMGKLHRATLERGFTTENSLGHGFWLMLNTCDRLWLRSTPQGTTVVLELDKHQPEPEWLTRPRELADYLGGEGDAVA